MMTTRIGKKAIAISAALLVVGLVIGAIVGMYAVPPREITKEVIKEVPIEVIKEVIKEVPKEVIKEVPKEVIKEVPVEVVKEVEKEVPMKLPLLAEKIRKGEIDVGEAYGMAPNQRYHTIHAMVIGLECSNCHVEKIPPEAIFAQKPPGAPGPVDKRVCLGCHLTGPATNLYTPERP